MRKSRLKIEVKKNLFKMIVKIVKAIKQQNRKYRFELKKPKLLKLRI